jgi:HD superfamily phosphohydrolase
MKNYEIRDPVYGFISFNDWEKEIINQAAFQRLRRIRQLALTDMVYPVAAHTRFEHSLGVMHLATIMYDAIINNDKNKKILEERLSYNDAGLKKDRQLIRLAALLHDVGHAPFSHASEDIMPINNLTGKAYKHENYTMAIIKYTLKDIIENHQINYGCSSGKGKSFY